MASNGRPRVLITNDDGIKAPGLVALVSALAEADFCDLYVCAPSGERSAQSHAITLGRYLACWPSPVEGAKLAFAVDGTPADSTMLALNSDLFAGCGGSFDLVASGINRGDNCGMHVIYSGTVGAAREAACKFLPAIAFSLDSHVARSTVDYAASARLAAALVRAMLAVLGGSEAAASALAAGRVINVNFPADEVRGLHLTSQGLACVHPAFKEVTEQPGPHLPEVDEHTPQGERMFRNYAGEVRGDATEGCDTWAVKRGLVSVTPLGLRSDVALPSEASSAEAAALLQVVGDIVAGAAQAAGLPAGGLPVS